MFYLWKYMLQMHFIFNDIKPSSKKYATYKVLHFWITRTFWAEKNVVNIRRTWITAIFALKKMYKIRYFEIVQNKKKKNAKSINWYMLQHHRKKNPYIHSLRWFFGWKHISFIWIFFIRFNGSVWWILCMFGSHATIITFDTIMYAICEQFIRAFKAHKQEVLKQKKK